MKLAWLTAALLATAACEQKPSPLDQLPSPSPSSGAASAGAPSGDLEARVARLEQEARERADMMQWLDSVYEAQLQKEAKPQPRVVYGVDIQQNVQLGQVEGAPDALVTIVEAWDFA